MKTPPSVETKRPPSEVVSVRLADDVMQRVEHAAHELGETVSQFVRNAVLERLDGYEVTAVDRLGTSANRLVVRHRYAESWTEADVQDVDVDVRVPNSPPTTASGSF